MKYLFLTKRVNSRRKYTYDELCFQKIITEGKGGSLKAYTLIV
jgi:hypothetical protein